MSVLADVFDVIRGWEPGGDASVEHSLPPELVMGVPVTLLPGYVVVQDVAGDVNVATSPGNVTLGTANVPQVYVVVEGNSSDTSAQFVGKVVCLRGKITCKTDKLNLGQTFPVAGQVTYSAGLLSDKAGGATTHSIGVVLENNVATDGTIVVDFDL